MFAVFPVPFCLSPHQANTFWSACNNNAVSTRFHKCSTGQPACFFSSLASDLAPNAVLGVIMLSPFCSSSPPPPTHWSRSPSGATGDHSVTDRPRGARRTVYSSFGVSASCRLQYPPHCCTSQTCPALVPTREVHIYYKLLYRGGDGSELMFAGKINTLLAQGFNLSYELCSLLNKHTDAHVHKKAHTNKSEISYQLGRSLPISACRQTRVEMCNDY